jgi:hypothetical protein
MSKWRKNTDREIQGIFESIDSLRKDLNQIGDLVQCETCGCLLRKITAIKGKSIIHSHKEPVPHAFYYSGGQLEREVEEIYTPYFCKIHKEG